MFQKEVSETTSVCAEAPNVSASAMDPSIFFISRVFSKTKLGELRQNQAEIGANEVDFR